MCTEKAVGQDVERQRTPVTVARFEREGKKLLGQEGGASKEEKQAHDMAREQLAQRKQQQKQLGAEAQVVQAVEAAVGAATQGPAQQQQQPSVPAGLGPTEAVVSSVAARVAGDKQPDINVQVTLCKCVLQ